MPRRWVACIAAVVVAAAANALAADAPHAFSAEITADDFVEHVRVLASDDFGGRDPATPGEEKTLAYLQAQLRRLGLQPGNGDSYLQAVPFQLRMADLAHSRASLRAGGRTLALDLRERAVLGSDTGQARVEVADSALVFVGYGIDAPEEGWNDFAGADLRGRTAVFLAGEPDGKAADGRERFDGRRLTVHARSGAKFEHAARHGATAALMIHDTKSVGYDWAGVRLRWHNREFALRPADRDSKPIAVQGWLSGDAARDLFAAAGVSLVDASQAAAQPGFRAIPLGDATFAATLAGKVLLGRSHNVVAILPGTTRPGEAVLYSAHWDGLGTQPGKAGDNIYNGALDNASGVAALLEIAESFATQDPRPVRSVVFFLPTLEELGLIGSRWYTQHPVLPLARTVADLNFDMVVPIGRARNFVVIGHGYSELDAVVEPIAAARGRKVEAETGDDQFLRSDHANFARVGVPVLYLRGGTQAVASPGSRERREPDEAWNEIASVYHTPEDEFSRWDLRGIAEDIAIAHAVGRQLANSDGWPNWHAHTPFRAIRDASRAGE